MHNVVKGEFDRISVNEENYEREIVSQEPEDADIILKVHPVPAPRRTVGPGEPGEAGEGRGEQGGEGGGEEGAACGGRAPRTTAQTAEYRQEFPLEGQ